AEYTLPDLGWDYAASGPG
nr:RecName: Full=Superoxide dismutase [Mn] [Mycobacterium simiae]